MIRCKHGLLRDCPHCESESIGAAQNVEAVVKLQERIAELEAENAALRLRLLSAAGDDLCRLTQEEIKAYTSGKVQIPPKEEFIASCERFHAQIAGEAGVLNGCLTLAQLISENAALREDKENMDFLERQPCHALRDFSTGPHWAWPLKLTRVAISAARKGGA